MAKFDNYQRWFELKSAISNDKKLVAIIQDILKDRSNLFHGTDYQTGSTLDLYERISAGSSRDTIRLGRRDSHKIKLCGNQIILALKVPCRGCDNRNLFLYESVDDLGEDKHFNLDELNQEARRFETAALNGKSVPAVTGIIAGYGILGTITEDITRGGLFEVIEPKYQTSARIFTKIRMNNGDIIRYTTDFKYLGISHSDNDYLKERLQIDKVSAEN